MPERYPTQVRRKILNVSCSFIELNAISIHALVNNCSSWWHMLVRAFCQIFNHVDPLLMDEYITVFEYVRFWYKSWLNFQAWRSFAYNSYLLWVLIALIPSAAFDPGEVCVSLVLILLDVDRIGQRERIHQMSHPPHFHLDWWTNSFVINR